VTEKRMGVWVLTGLLLLVMLPSAAIVQQDFQRAVESARRSWLNHDMERLVSGSDTVRLRIPGIAPSASLKPGQAARLLEQYLKPAEEVSFEVRRSRELSDSHVYAEMIRVYVVRGTDEERSETVVLGFRRIEGHWTLREVRVTP
jgi:hypothetical protein